MRPASQNNQFIFFYSQIVILFLILIIGGCTHFNPENGPNPSTQKKVEQSYFSNGNLEYEAEFVNGKLDGTSKVWLKDGTLYSVSQYSNDQPHGAWKKFHPNGKLMFTSRCTCKRFCKLLQGAGCLQYRIQKKMVKPTILFAFGKLTSCVNVKPFSS